MGSQRWDPPGPAAGCEMVWVTWPSAQVDANLRQVGRPDTARRQAAPDAAARRRLDGSSSCARVHTAPDPLACVVSFRTVQ